MPLYTRREIVVLLAVVLLGAAGVGVDRWRREHPDLANRLEALDRAPAPITPATPTRISAPAPARLRTDRALGGARTLDRATRAGHRDPDRDPPVDLNLASQGELARLPGVGPTLAARIVEARARDGPFGSVEDLRRVRGVGRATLERLRPLLAVNTP